jgi:hypothetical protein
MPLFLPGPSASVERVGALPPLWSHCDGRWEVPVWACSAADSSAFLCRVVNCSYLSTVLLLDLPSGQSCSVLEAVVTILFLSVSVWAGTLPCAVHLYLLCWNCLEAGPL